MELKKPIKAFKGGDAKIHTPNQICQTLEAGTSGGGGTSNRPVVVIPKQTNTPSKSTKGTSPNTKTMAIQQELFGKKSQILTSFVLDSLVNRFLSLASEEVLKIHEVHSFLKSAKRSGLKDPAIYCLKMSKAYYPHKEVGITSQSKLVWGNWDISHNDRHLIARILVSPKTGKECSLSDILEENVDQKYFLSEKATATLFREIQKQRNSLPIQLQENMEQETPEGPT